MFSTKNKDSIIDKSNIPVHIAIVMDGNGRWARKRGLPRSIGHAEGAKTLKKVVRYCGDLGVKHLTVYAFSTENWKRPREEVDSLMKLLMDYLKNADKEIGRDNVRIRVIGNRKVFSQEFCNEIDRVEKMTRSNDGITLNIALNYGSRDEIVFAFKTLMEKCLKDNRRIGSITEDDISGCLYTHYMPDPDLVIRPSGELRLSNFLLWQSAYSEFWYSDILWPDFDRKHLYQAICDYQKRARRFGGV